MSSQVVECAAGIDIGAGSGAKLALFDSSLHLLAESFLPVERYGTSPDALAEGLKETIQELLSKNPDHQLTGCGVAIPGMVSSDGAIIHCNNLLFLDHCKLNTLLTNRLKVPVFTANDADAGGLAEWNHAREELLYWVLGGGLGGCWVSAEGHVKFSAVDWDGKDDSLHFSNEPGYSIPISKSLLKTLFEQVGGNYEDFEKVCLNELAWKNNTLTGPNGNAEYVRAELLVSGSGRWRLFQSFAAGDNTYATLLTPKEAEQLRLPSSAGKVINKLSHRNVAAAKKTDTLFGLLLAQVAWQIFHGGPRGNCPDGIPIYLSGKPSMAIDLFGPVAQEAMRAKGLNSKLRLSWYSKKNQNANLAGAAALVWKKSQV